MSVKVQDLKPGMNNVNIVVRVLDVSEPKRVMTRSGERTISEAVVGDETGRVKLTLWGKASGSVSKGDVIEIRGAWTTSFKGYVQLNVGGSRSIKKLGNEAVAKEDEIPDTSPKAIGNYRSSRRRPRRRTYGRSSKRSRE